MSRVKWNHSLDKTVRLCDRKAFYTAVYASPVARPESLRREAHLLKQAIDRRLWRGNIVHLVIQEYILPRVKSGLTPNYNRASELAVELVEKQALFSKLGRYRTESKSSSKLEYCVLRSDLLGLNTDNSEIEAIKAEVQIAIANLENNFGDIVERASSAVELGIEKEIHFSIDEWIRMDAKIDLLIFDSDKSVAIVDWKVGDGISGNAREQLQAYAFAVAKCGYWRNISPEQIELIEANLYTGDRVIYTVSEDDLADVDDRIFIGAQLLKPIFEHSAKITAPEYFSAAKSPGACEWCVVKEMCNGNLRSRIESQTGKQQLSFEFV